MKVENTGGYPVLRALLDAFNEDTASVLALFNTDATVEYPYAESMGKASLLTMDDYRIYLDGILPYMPDISFSNIRLYPLQDQSSYWTELHGETIHPATGARYQQDYVLYFTLQNGKFSKYREYWNVLPALQSLLPKDEVQRILDLKSSSTR